MRLYFAPLACSFASRATLYELGITADYSQVTLVTKTLADDSDFYAINPKGQVPALATDDGRVITESPVVLQYLADLRPAAGLAPPRGSAQRISLEQWLNLLCSEVHSAAFVPMFHPASTPDAKAFAKIRLQPKFDLLERHLTGRDYLIDSFSIGDIYLTTMLGWCEPAGIDLGAWPVLAAFRDRIRARPAVGRALGDELALR